jgi:hypothetical protein
MKPHSLAEKIDLDQVETTLAETERTLDDVTISDLCDIFNVKAFIVIYPQPNHPQDEQIDRQDTT